MAEKHKFRSVTLFKILNTKLLNLRSDDDDTQEIFSPYDQPSRRGGKENPQHYMRWCVEMLSARGDV